MFCLLDTEEDNFLGSQVKLLSCFLLLTLLGGIRAMCSTKEISGEGRKVEDRLTFYCAAVSLYSLIQGGSLV